MQFSQIVGQRELKAHLIQEVNSDKISHAQLFLGNSGHGTLPIVLAFVQYLFCEQRGADDSCGRCSSCRKVSDLQHPDLHFSFPVVQALSKFSNHFLPDWRAQIKQNPYFDLTEWTARIDEKGRTPIIGSEESLEIIKKLSLKSYEGGYKVMLIWKPEEMNAVCSNKLLKILEEPPVKTLFLLVAENQDQLLPTILSRTQLVKVPKIDLDELAESLRGEFDVDASTAWSVAAQTEGNRLEAMHILTANEQKDINRELFIQLMRVSYKKDVIPMMDWAESMASQGKDKQKNFLKYALHMFRQSLLKNYTENQLTRVSKEEDQFLQNFARFITGNNITDFMEHFNDAYYHIDRNANPRILFTELCFKVMRFIHFA